MKSQNNAVLEGQYPNLLDHWAVCTSLLLKSSIDYDTGESGQRCKTLFDLGHTYSQSTYSVPMLPNVYSLCIIKCHTEWPNIFSLSLTYESAICLSIILSIYLSTYPCLCLSIYLSIYHYFYLSIYQSILYRRRPGCRYLLLTQKESEKRANLKSFEYNILYNAILWKDGFWTWKRYLIENCYL